MDKEVSKEVLEQVGKFHDITSRVIVPAKVKGIAHAMEAAQAFLRAQSRANERHRGQPLRNNSVLVVCNRCDPALPL